MTGDSATLGNTIAGGTVPCSMLFVHAHPDDETIFTGATMAHYAALGTRVALVTCTLGEQGDIYVPELAHLAADQADQLGGYRFSELRTACGLLGVSQLRMLGGAGRYRDSGMPGTSGNAHHRAFGYTDVASAIAELADIIVELKPEVVLTYDESGLTAHPDHVRTHHVTMAAIRTAADPARIDRWEVREAYAPTFPRGLLEAGQVRFRASSENPFADVGELGSLPFVTADGLLDARVDGSPHAEAKLAALAAHATQIRPDTWLYALATNLGIEPTGVEYYRRLPLSTLDVFPESVAAGP
ncbi:MAG: N-acetyl-1-D-myo-inositol-2-amino-2-deoxy-alpha-D-glucopyranoside deacetylase [Mycobacteriales bacterium]